jgi:hypothetical protein
MKLWRGQPDHNHWRALITPRDLAWGKVGIGVMALVMSVYAYFSPGSSCDQGGKWLCTAVRSLAPVMGGSLELAEVVLWGLVTLGSAVAAWRQWRRGPRR